MAETTLTELLTGIGMETPSEEIPESALEASRYLLLDALGCAIAGHAQPGVRESVGLMRDWGGKAEATVLTDGARLPACRTRNRRPTAPT